MQSLHVLLEHESHQRDQALARWQQAASRAAAAQAQVQQLADYRGEYQRRWRHEFGHGSTIQVMQCYQAFTARLEQALAQQQRTLQQAQAQVERAGAALQAHELRVASVRKLIERRMVEHRRAEDRRENKRSDEAAGRAAHYGTAAWAHASQPGAL